MCQYLRLKNKGICILYAPLALFIVMCLEKMTAIYKKLKVENYTIEEIPGNDHHYENIKQIKEMILKGA